MQQQWNLDNFQIIEFISKGRFGSVWKSICKLTQKTVALKVVYFSYSPQKGYKREIELHYRMNHKHIAELYGYFHDDYFVYLVMEYCPNANLFYYLKNFHPLPETEIAKLFLELTAGVDYIHQRNVIHRDLKLENILLDQNFSLKISDFGYAVHTLGPRDSYCGTLSYMTIEQLNKQIYGKEVDIWCLGCILYELTFKISPFQGTNEEATIKNIKEQLLVIPLEIRQISEELVSLIKELLNPDPVTRIKIEQILGHPFFKKQIEIWNNQ